MNEQLFENCLQTAEQLLTQSCSLFTPVVFSSIAFTRATSYWMQIQFNSSNDSFDLKIGSLFDKIQDENLKKERLISSCIHELIHTIPGCWNHGSKFKEIASSVNQTFPEYHVSTSTSVHSLINLEITKRVPRWQILCNSCNNSIMYTRRPKYIANFNDMYSCTICGNSCFTINNLT